MSKRPFREHHLLELLYAYDQQTLPMDRYISIYFKSHPALGSKDRGEIAETIYGMVRWLGLLEHLGGNTWEKRLDLYRQGLTSATEDVSIPLHVRVSFPEDLFNRISNNYGEERAKEICLESNRSAPTTVRANVQKISREDLLKKWEGQWEVSPCQIAPHGIVFHKKTNFFVLPEFKEGLFEVQDEGSQLLAYLVAAKPGQSVMDYCSGSGGKTLAFGPQMENKGQIYLHDIRDYILDEAKKRLRRAGLQNAQVVHENEDKLKKLKKKMDWVLIDVPCSGTGTLRRNPDMKYKFDNSAFEKLLGEQRSIFEKGLSFVKPGGSIVYGTCSLLKEENQDQVDHFVKTYDLEVVGEEFQTFPKKDCMDGFYGRVLRKK